MRLRTFWIASSATLMLPLASAWGADAKPEVVADGRQISIEYTLSFDDGTKPQTSGAEPLAFRQGAKEILPALETALAGMKVGESRKVTLDAAKGYGEPNPQLIQEVDVEQIPEAARVAGAELAAEDPEGHQHYVRVQEVRADKIVVDMNHPLAGKTLHFDVKVVKIE